jgi:hypothetical protein
LTGVIEQAVRGGLGHGEAPGQLVRGLSAPFEVALRQIRQRISHGEPARDAECLEVHRGA